MNDFFLVLLAFIVFVGIHILVLHLVGPSRFIRNGIIILLIFISLPVLSFGAKLVFVSLWNMYMFALICSRNSVSLRILDEIREGPEVGLTKLHLLEKFSDRESLSSRIEIMEQNKFLRSVAPNVVELSKKGRILARGILLGRALFGVQNPG